VTVDLGVVGEDVGSKGTGSGDERGKEEKENWLLL
jgi:hypothetical protein